MTPDRDVLWRKYLNTVWTGGTPEQRQFAWDRYWKAEMADVRRCFKQTQAKAAHA